MNESADGMCMWLYGVTSSGTALPDEVSGVAGEPVRQIEEAGLVALAGAVPQSEFGQAAVKQNLEHLDWLSAVAGAHDAVVRSAMDSTAVIPIRLVTLFSDEAAIRSLLRSHHADFEKTLSHLAGRTEWGVKAFGAPEAETDTGGTGGAGGAGGAASQPASVPEAGSGTSYLLRRQAARTHQQRTLQAAGECSERLHARLAALSVADRRNPLRAAATHGSGPIVLNGTYLVEDRCFEAFRAAVIAETEHEAIRAELTGPWPPYSFASVPGLTADA